MTRKEAAKILISIAVYQNPVPIAGIFCHEHEFRFLRKAEKDAMRQDIAKRGHSRSRRKYPERDLALAEPPADQAASLLD